jgi:hydroxymethylglutaryl-CoA reductase
MKTSKISGFYKKSIKERLDIVKDFAELSDEDIRVLTTNSSGVDMDIMDQLVENVIGCMPLPLGIATNFLINGKDYMIPMAIDETSVIAGASHGAKIIRESGGIIAIAPDSLMIGQIQVTNTSAPYAASVKILQKKEEIIKEANKVDPILVSLGGGLKDIETTILDTEIGKMIDVHLIIDVRDAMGANAINSIAEKIAPIFEEITGGKVCLKILSNLADKRLVKAIVTIKKEIIGEEAVDGIVKAYQFANATPYRAATHNKGVMNGVSALALATGNDFRALEAGVHSYAARSGQYKPISIWEKDAKSNLTGSIEFPAVVGIVGGVSKLHPVARVALKILNVKSASELGTVFGALGLVQNYVILKELATVGIQKGHMSLHAKNIAMMAGASGELVDKIAEKMVKENCIRLDIAQKFLKEISR